MVRGEWAKWDHGLISCYDLTVALCGAHGVLQLEQYVLRQTLGSMRVLEIDTSLHMTPSIS